MRNYITGRLGYNPGNCRYGLLVMVRTRMEMDMEKNWYLVGTPYHGNLEFVQARMEKEKAFVAR